MRKNKKRNDKVWPLTQSVYGVMIKWDNTVKNVDLDLQAVIVDDKGHIADAVYYNNLLALNGAVGLSGDNSEDESIWVRMEKLPSQVRLIIFVVAAYSGGSLRDISNGRVTVLERQKTCTQKFKEFRIERSRSDADMVLMFKRFRDATWGIVELDEPAEKGSHFLDILEPTIGDLIRSEIPNAPSMLKVGFVMEKGAVVDFPQGEGLERLIVAVGGTFVNEDVRDMSVELQAFFFSATGELRGHFRGDTRRMFGVERVEDEMEDEEAVRIDLTKVPESVDQIFLVLNIEGDSFKSVENAVARVVDQSLSEIMRYEVLAAGHEESGLVIARVLRKATSKRWGVETVGHFVKGENLQEEVSSIAATLPTDATKSRSKPQKAPHSPKTPTSRKAAAEPPSPKTPTQDRPAPKLEPARHRLSTVEMPMDETGGTPNVPEGAASSAEGMTAPCTGGDDNIAMPRRRAIFGGTRRFRMSCCLEPEDDQSAPNKVLAHRSPRSSFYLEKENESSPQENEGSPTRSSAILGLPAPRTSLLVSLDAIPEAVLVQANKTRESRTGCPDSQTQGCRSPWTTPRSFDDGVVVAPCASPTSPGTGSAPACQGQQPGDNDHLAVKEQWNFEEMPPFDTAAGAQPVCRGTCALAPSFCIAEVSHKLVD